MTPDPIAALLAKLDRISQPYAFAREEEIRQCCGEAASALRAQQARIEELLGADQCRTRRQGDAMTVSDPTALLAEAKRNCVCNSSSNEPGYLYPVCFECRVSEALRAQQAQIEELRRDGERLDWLEQQLIVGWEVDDWRHFGRIDKDGIRLFKSNSDETFDEKYQATPMSKTLRAAIDAARSQSEED